MKNLTMLVSIAALSLLAACATPGPKVKEDQLKSVRKVAVVGFTSMVEVPDTLKNMGPVTPMSNAIPNLNTFAKQTPTAEHILQQASKDLSSKMGWKVLSPEEVIREDAYGDIYVGRMKNWKSMMTPDRAYQIHFVKNVLPTAESASFTQDVRDHLMNALKVDGLLEVQYRSGFATDGLAVMGLAAKKAQSKAMFRLYKKGVAEPIWDDQDAEGDKTNDSLSFKLGGYDMSQEKELMELYENSTRLATLKLLNRKDIAAEKK